MVVNYSIRLLLNQIWLKLRYFLAISDVFEELFIFKLHSALSAIHISNINDVPVCIKLCDNVFRAQNLILTQKIIR